MGNRFDYVAYDEKSQSQQAIFKQKFTELAADVESILGAGRAQSLIFTKLEEAYMWTGKAIRDNQLKRAEGTTQLQEQRTNS